ncbi:MAG TPA: septum formation protein Maf [Anaerolineaceae bacterium]|jgi:MAF protein|nr:septum formation protein Maf [Anaerolineaceae bacterium]
MHNQKTFSLMIKFALDMVERKLILASGSPRRNELLRLLGIPFNKRPADIDERKFGSESPRQYVERMALEKGQTLEVLTDELVLSADTIVDLEGLVLGKPVDLEDAKWILKLMRGKTHRVHTALSLHNGEEDTIAGEVCLTLVKMRNYSDEEIDAYLARNDYRDKAGGYAIQDGQFHPVEQVEGCYANVMGLPLCHVYRLLKKAGVSMDVEIADLCQRYNDINCEVFPSILNEQKNENNF